MDVGQLIANWVPGPILALIILGLVKREVGRLEGSLGKLEKMADDLTKAMTELQIMSREFITIRSHGESTSRIYEEIRKMNDSTRERLLKLELQSKKCDDE